jgi:hypothetical protein
LTAPREQSASVNQKRAYDYLQTIKQPTLIVGEHVINNTSSLIGKPDATVGITNGVWSLSGRGQIHQGQAVTITVKVRLT